MEPVAGRAHTIEPPRVGRARKIWIVGWSIPGSPGLLIALLVLRPSTSAELVVTTWVLTFGFGVAVAISQSKRRQGLAGLATVAAVVVMSSIGIARVTGPFIIPLLLLAGLSYPSIVQRITAWLRVRLPSSIGVGVPTLDNLPGGSATRQSGLAATLSDGADLVDIGLLSDAELCLGWRRGYVALQRLQQRHDDLHPGAGPRHTTCCLYVLGQQQHVVAQRQSCLDELERRDRSGFYRWLYNGARPASDPSRYLRSSQPPNSRPTDHTS